jgi:signal transduction histidine kinase
MYAPDDRETRLAFLELGEEDVANLRHLAPLLEKHADSFVAAFYRHLLSFDFTRALLADPDVKDRLLVKQREYLLSLASPNFDDAYFRGRIAIGETHVRVGLEPRWYLGAYSLYQRLLVPVIFEHFRTSPALMERVVVSLQKRLTLDAQLAMESYIERREARLGFLNRELAQSARDLERRYDVEHERLRETDARARAAEELASGGTIVAGLAHEIGTPMGVIQGHAKLLRVVGLRRSRQAPAADHPRADRPSRTSSDAVNGRGRASAGGPWTSSPCCARRSVGRTAARAWCASRSSCRRACRCAAADKLRQLFINLVMNAIDAMLEGGGCVDRRAFPESSRCGWSTRPGCRPRRSHAFSRS